MSEMEKLADCPFCGANAQRANELSHDDHAIECISCFATTGLCETAEDAVIRWNTRQHATALEIGRGIGREEAAKVCEEEAGHRSKIAAAFRLRGETKDAECREFASGVLIGLAEHIRASSPALDVDGMVERCAERVHVAYLETAARLEWRIDPECNRPYADLPDDAKELDRATARAVLASLGVKNG